MPVLLYADDLLLCDETEDDLRAEVGRFAEVCRRRTLKFNAGKSKGVILNGEEGLECEVHVDRTRLEHVSEFKYLGCLLDESATDEAECSRKVANERGVADAIRFLVNARDMQLVLRDGSETMLWKEL